MTSIHMAGRIVKNLRFQHPDGCRKIVAMQALGRTSSGILVAAGFGAAVLVLALAFTGWLRNGSAILLALAETGASWCF